MSADEPGADELDAAIIALEAIAERVAGSRHRFDDSSDRQLALVLLWVNVGSQLKQYCRKRSIPGGTEPFAGPIRMRDKLVYGSLPDLRASIVWDTCIRDGPDLQVLLRDLRATL
ncbi:MAG: hypothetical protein KGQ66_01615 [Acidobacteriota bacterium]|nr:hypothetical protein [Acidobacteriota bacterium]